MNSTTFTTMLTAVMLVVACSSEKKLDQHVHQASLQNGAYLTLPQDTMETNNNGKVVKTEEEWRELLTWNEYRVLRNRGTEVPYANEYWDNEKEGIYYCGACGQPLYSSAHKYKSGTGWPSFWQPLDPSYVAEREDNSLFMTRTEIVCSRCDSHLGHVFEDGPDPTGLRYCMNSAALDFKEQNIEQAAP